MVVEGIDPNADPNHQRKGVPRVGKPVKAGVEDAERAQNVVKYAKVAVGNPTPYDGVDSKAGGPR